MSVASPTHAMLPVTGTGAGSAVTQPEHTTTPIHITPPQPPACIIFTASPGFIGICRYQPFGSLAINGHTLRFGRRVTVASPHGESLGPIHEGEEEVGGSVGFILG